MSGIHTTSGVPRQPPDCPALEANYRELVELAFGSLGCEVLDQADDCLRIVLAPECRAVWDDRAELRIAFAPHQTDGTPSPEAQSFLARLCQQLSEKSPALHAAPADQPASVHQLTPQIYAPYTVDNGHTRLSGCSLEPRPFLRLTYPGSGSDWRHVYLDETCTPLDSQRIERLGLEHLEPFPVRQQALSRAQLQSWIEQAKAAANGAAAATESPFPLATVLWCRYASGKLNFEIGEQAVSLHFEDWASDLASGRTRMPAYRCPLSGRETYHLVADDEGRLTAAEAIAICEVSGRRVIETDLEICQETGRRAMKEYLATCEQTHRRVLKSILQACDMCHRQLASVSLVNGRCEACRHLTPVSKDDPTLARLLHQYAKLDTWKRWRIGETQRLFIFTAASWLQRILLVVDKESLEVRRMATRGRFGHHWIDAPPKLLEELTS